MVIYLDHRTKKMCYIHRYIAIFLISFILPVLVDNISLKIPLQEVAAGEFWLKFRRVG